MLINTQRRNLLRQSRQIVKLVDHHSSFPFCDRAAPLSHQPIHLRRETVTVVPPPKASAPTSHHPPRYSHSDRRSLHRRYIFERFGQLLLEVQAEKAYPEHPGRQRISLERKCYYGIGNRWG